MQIKRQLLLLILASLTVFSYGQSFAPLGAKWYYSAQAGGMAPQNSEYYLYESQKDTIMDGQSCKKLTVTYYKYLNGDTVYLPPVFVYQSTDTVYYYNMDYSKYFPLYIFNVSQGDTLTFHSPNIPFNPSDTIWKAVVDSITSLIIDSDTLKRVWTSDIGAYSFWGGYIEKLGCPFLMFHQPHTIFPEWDGPMRCYSDSSISYNFFTFSCDYRLITEINELENPYEVLVFPNPAQNVINFEVNFETKKLTNSYLIITDIVGQQMGKYNIEAQDFPVIVNTEPYNNGIYFYSIYHKGVQKKTEKFIISK